MLNETKKEKFNFLLLWNEMIDWSEIERAAPSYIHQLCWFMNCGLLVIGFHSSSFQLNSTCLHSINFLYLSIKLTYLLFKEQFQSINERGMEMSWMGWKLITHCPLIKRKVYFSFIEGWLLKERNENLEMKWKDLSEVNEAKAGANSKQNQSTHQWN